MQHVELCGGGPCDGSYVVVPDDSDRYLCMVNNTSLNSIHPQEKPLPEVQIGYYLPPAEPKSLHKLWTKWMWAGYQAP